MRASIRLVLLPLTLVLLIGSNSNADILRIRGVADTAKTLTVYGHVDDGLLTASDFTNQDFLVGSVALAPNPNPVNIDFDITNFLNSLPGGTPFFGFNLSESESS